MTSDEQGRQAVPMQEDGQADRPNSPRRKRLRIFLIVLAVLLIVFIVPPMISIGHYKSRITQAISQSFGRPVRLASVELRLLPWPGFVLTDLTVAEDPAYGAEPVLHANTVTANIRLLSLWRGRLEISSVSVDEASLNVVRAAPGRWNLDPFFRTAAASHGPAAAGPVHRLPYLEATNSRINFKNGAEKLPFSVVNTDLSLWQENPGEWRLRLRGQPARTDVVLDMADTGIVRLEASVHRAPELRNMPLNVDVDWREAQLGQLSRLLIGSDPGWRGDLTGELHVQGTPDSAQISARLRASGVRRAEFVPESPMDFDANCGFVYHYSLRALDNLVCNSPLGDGHLRLTGDMPGGSAQPNLTLALDNISAAAGLDLLRTMRSGIASDLEAAGTISGKLSYQRQPGDEVSRNISAKARHTHAKGVARGPLTGSLTVEGFALSGGSLSLPLRIPKIVLEPALAVESGSQQPQVLEGNMTIPAGGAVPLTVNLKLALYGYQAAVHGQAGISRSREIAKLAGPGGAALLDGVAGEPLTANLLAEGPWLTSGALSPAGPSPLPAPAHGAQQQFVEQPSAFDHGLAPITDSIRGTVTLHNANWRADYLANHVQIAEATLHLGGDTLLWDPVSFSYGPVKGTASISWPLNCAQPQEAITVQAAAPCAAHFDAQFGALDAGDIEAAFLGAKRKSSLFSDLIERFHPDAAPLWPAFEGTVKADSLLLGPVKLSKPSATVKIADDHAAFSGLQAGILGGQMQAQATLHWFTGDATGPAYTFTAECDRLNAAAVAQLLNLRWSGGPIQLGGKLDLSGFTGKQLAASARGTLHFNWSSGSMAPAHAVSKPEAARALAQFSRWSGDAQVADGAVTLGQNQLLAAGQKFVIQGAVTFGEPAKVKFAAVRAPQSR